MQADAARRRICFFNAATLHNMTRFTTLFPKVPLRNNIIHSTALSGGSATNYRTTPLDPEKTTDLPNDHSAAPLKGQPQTTGLRHIDPENATGGSSWLVTLAQQAQVCSATCSAILRQFRSIDPTSVGRLAFSSYAAKSEASTKEQT